MTTYNVTVDTDGTSGDYSVLAAAEAGEQSGKVSGDIVNITCQATTGAADTTAVTIQGYADGVFLNISGNAEGKVDVSKYRLSNSGHVVYIRQPNVTIKTVQITGVTAGGNYGVRAGQYEDTDFVIDGCIFHNLTGDRDTAGIGIGDRPGNKAKIINSVFYGIDGAAVYVANASSDIALYNNTIYACNQSQNGYRAGLYVPSASATKAINTICYDNYNEDFRGGFAAGSDYNFSKDATAPGSNSIHGDTDNKTPDFTSTISGSEDLHIQSTSNAISVGIGPALDSNVPPTDIDGDTRSGATTDIGADLFGAVILPIIGTLGSTVGATANLSGKIGVGGGLVASSGAATLANQGQEGKQGPLNSQLAQLLGLLSGGQGISGDFSSILSQSAMAMAGKQGAQGPLSGQVSLAAQLFGSTDDGTPQVVVEGTLSSVAGALEAALSGQTGSTGSLASQVIAAASLAGQIGASGSYTMQLDGVSSILEAALGVSGGITASVSAGADIAGKIGVAGDVIAALDDLGLQLIEILKSDRIYQIILSTKTGQVVFLAPKTATIDISTST